MNDAVDKVVHDEQAGLRSSRIFTDQIATLKIIVKQLVKWQIFMYIIFIDFEQTGLCNALVSMGYQCISESTMIRIFNTNVKSVLFFWM